MEFIRTMYDVKLIELSGTRTMYDVKLTELSGTIREGGYLKEN
jgi:hypothetical protein